MISGTSNAASVPGRLGGVVADNDPVNSDKLPAV